MSSKIFLFMISLTVIFSQTSTTYAQDRYTPQQYIKDRNLTAAKIIPSGKLRIDGARMNCGRRPTVLDTTFNDFGGAFNGFIILNPKLLKRLPRQVKLWIYSHECAHQFHGGDEVVADCFGIKRGVRYGWLKKSGVDQICKFIWSAPATSMHPPGSERCQLMRACYKKIIISRKKKK